MIAWRVERRATADHAEAETLMENYLMQVRW